MVDVMKVKEPEEVRTIEVPFEDELEDWEDITDLEVSPYKLTGSTPRLYNLDISDTNELIIQKKKRGQPKELQSLDVFEGVSAKLEVFASEDPVEAPEIFVDDSTFFQQKQASFQVQGGANGLSYLIQVDVKTTEENEISKEVRVDVERE